MPILATAGCRYGRCPAHATTRGYCSAHAKLAERERGTSTQRGYGHGWPEARAKHLAQNPWCACLRGVGRYRKDGCGQRADDVDHIESIRNAPERRLDPTNFRSYSHGCHSRRTAVEQSGWGRNPLRATRLT